MSANSLGALVCTALSLVPVLAIWSMVISSACRLARVRPPEFFPGMVVAFALIAMNLIAMFAVAVIYGLATGVPILAGHISATQVADLLRESSPIAALTNPLVSAAVFLVMIEDCSYPKALLVWLLQAVVVILFLLVIAGIAYALKVR
jgi:hypothetical protein